MEFPSLAEASQLIMKLWNKGDGLTFDEIETKFRKENSLIYLFGEDPEKSKVLRGCSVYQMKPYVLNISIRASRSIALMDVESGCHDQLVNLLRLKDTGFVVSDMNCAEEVNRLCQYGSIGGKSTFVEPFFSRMKQYLHEHPIEAGILASKGICIEHFSQ